MSKELQKTDKSVNVNAIEMRPAADIYEGEQDYRVVLDVPGVSQKDVDITVERDTLNVRAERHDGAEVVRYLRAFSLPQTINGDAVAATLSAGVLTVTLPKVEAVKPRQIKVKAA